MAERSPEFRRFSEDSVRRRTGKSWSDWVRILDDWGASAKSQAERAAHLTEAHGISPWWAQAVAERYENERGAR